MHHASKKLVLFLALVFSQSFLGWTVFAAGGAITVTPAKIEIPVTDSSSITRALRVANTGTETVRVDMSVVNLTKDSSGALGLSGGDAVPSAKSFVQLSGQTITIPAGAEATVPFVVSVPGVVADGGYYAGIEITASGSEVRSGVAHARSRLVVLLFVRVGTNAKESGVLSAFSVLNGDRLIVGSPAFQLSYKNDGAVYENPYGGIDIKNILGQSTSLRVDPWFVLPGSTRSRVIEGGDRFWFGPYTATVRLNRGYQNIVDTKQVSFFVVPRYWYVLPLLLLILAAIWFFARVRIRT